jgi:hypothetical protein
VLCSAFSFSRIIWIPSPCLLVEFIIIIMGKLCDFNVAKSRSLWPIFVSFDQSNEPKHATCQSLYFSFQKIKTHRNRASSHKAMVNFNHHTWRLPRPPCNPTLPSTVILLRCGLEPTTNPPNFVLFEGRLQNKHDGNVQMTTETQYGGGQVAC